MASRPSCHQLIDRMDAQTAEMLVNCGRKYQNTATTIATDNSGARIRVHRSRRRPGAAVGVSEVVETMVIAAVLAVPGNRSSRTRRRVQLEPAVAVVVHHLPQRGAADEAQPGEHRGHAGGPVQVEVIGGAAARV